MDTQILEEMPKDPWGNDYVYMNEGGKPVIISYGADGTAGRRGQRRGHLLQGRDAGNAKK